MILKKLEWHLRPAVTICTGKGRLHPHSILHISGDEMEDVEKTDAVP